MGEVLQFTRGPEEPKPAPKEVRRATSRFIDAACRLVEVYPELTAGGVELDEIGRALVEAARDPGLTPAQRDLARAIVSALISEAADQRIDERLDVDQEDDDSAA